MGVAENLGKSVGIVVCVLIFLAIILSVDIAAVVIGVNNAPPSDYIQNDPNNTYAVCEGDKVSFDMTKWLIIAGAVNMATAALLVILMLIVVIGKMKALATVFLLYSVLYAMFHFSWFVVGCVIMGQVERSCNEQVWDMGVAKLFFMALGLCSNCCAGAKQKKDDD